MRKYMLPVLMCLMCTHLAHAQLPTLWDKLRGEQHIEEIMAIVEDHYREIQSGLRLSEDEGNYKHWMRWGYEMACRTDTNGHVIDVNRAIRNEFNRYIATLPDQERSNEGNWIFRGPATINSPYGSAIGIGRVSRIAFHPTNENILYIGTPNGGLFKSTNGGSSWTALTDHIPSVSVSGIAISQQDPNKLYIVTGDGDASNGGFQVNSGHWRSSAGVFVSYDGGATWRVTAPLTTESYAGYNIALDPNNDDVVLAATTVGLFRTVDGGASWTEELEDLTYEVKYKPGSSQYVYAAQDGRMHWSSNGGAIWHEVFDFHGAELKSGRIAIAVSADAPDDVFMLSGWAPSGSVSECGNDPNENFGGIWRSFDNGESYFIQSWTPNIVESCCTGTNARSQSDYDLALAVSHENAEIFLGGGLLVWRTYNGGNDWYYSNYSICDWPQETGMVHVDMHDVEFNPLNYDVYVCTDGGLVKSSNYGITWTNLSEGIAATQIYHMGGSRIATNNIMIGSQDNGMKARVASSTAWNHVLDGDGFDCIYNYNGATSGYFTDNATVLRFSNNGETSIDISPVNEMFMRVTSAIHSSALVLVGASSIWRSTNSGDSWISKPYAGNWDIERCPDNINRFYAAGGASAFATTGSMSRSDDAGVTWDIISGNTGYPTGALRVTDISSNPTNSDQVWFTLGGVGAGKKVYYSGNAGQSWSNRSGTLPNIPINAIQVTSDNSVYIGTDIGVFYRGAGMSDWVPFWHNLPNVPVSDLELYEDENMIRASTFGRGVWESDMYSACTASMGLTGNLSGNKYYEVSATITSSSTLIGGENTRIVFKAGNAITLTTGFEAIKGNNLRAYIAACGEAVYDPW